MKPRLIEAKQQDINDRIRAHELDPATFGYRVQASECITHYIRRPSRALGKHVPAEALALYPKDRENYYITIEHDPHMGFRSSFRPALRRELSASVLTWEELMGILDRWLERLKRDSGSKGTRTVRRAAKESLPDEASLNRKRDPSDAPSQVPGS